MFGGTSHKLKGEAGLVVRDALRAARHAVRLGRTRYRSVRDRQFNSGPALEVLEGVDRLAQGAVDTASRLAHAAIDLVARQERVQLPCPAQVFLHPGPELGTDPKIVFAHSAYDALRRSLRNLGAANALIMEKRIEAAFVTAIRQAQGRDCEPIVFCASLSWELHRLQAISHVAMPASFGPHAASSETAIGRTASFALGLAMAAASCQGIAAEEADAMLDSACDLASALAEDISAAAGQDDFEILLASYAPHV